MTGGSGNDVYVVDNAGDRTIESPGGGNDTVRSSVSYTLAAYTETLVLTGAAAIDGTGNGLANILTGNAAANRLAGGEGNDVLDGGAGNDTLRGGSGSDWASYGSAAAGVTVNLGLTRAQQTGGAGEDVLELIENVTGSAFADTLTGNGASNILDGGDGDDILRAGGGADRLIGGLGADAMAGGKGDDVYVFDHSRDRTNELAGEGVDLVESSVSASLGANVEKLTLTGTAAISGTGNELANVLTGNSGRNTLRGREGDDVLDGRGGADTMIGGIGNDVYRVGEAGDVIFEAVGSGTDIVYASVSYTLAAEAEVERIEAAGSAGLSLVGSDYANLIIGTGDSDSLSGAGGDDILVGGTGMDGLSGGQGKDTFRFGAGDVGMGVNSGDRILDFVSGADLIDLAAVDADVGTAGDQAFTFIGSQAFSGVAGQLRFHVSDGPGVFSDGSRTFLEGDTNGDGAADFYILLSNGATPAASDFVL